MEITDEAPMDLRSLYLRQMIKSLTTFGADDFIVAQPGSRGGLLKRSAGRMLAGLVRYLNLELVRRVAFDAEKRSLGLDWPLSADTMIGVKRLENIWDCVRLVIEEEIPGDLVETGVWRGGGSIMMRATLEAYGDDSRRIWCADSFVGLPPPEMDRYPQDAGMTWHTHAALAVPLEQVKANFAKYDLLDDRVVFLKGWFKDTLPHAPIERIAVLRLDGDLYASTMDALESLYEKVSPSGFIIVDDYGMPEDTCRRAINDFRAARGISAPIHDIDGTGVFWRR